MQMKIRFDGYIFLFLGLAVLILWQMLLPGYVISLDMIPTPVISAGHWQATQGFLPLAYFLQFSNYFIPSWIIQKFTLLILFFLLGYLPFKFLPLPQNKTVRLFSALIYLANPFVYARLLAGHWGHLMAYAFLPLFFHFLLKFANAPNFRSSLKLFGSIFLISLFSPHFFAMTFVILILFGSFSLIKNLQNKNFSSVKSILKFGFAGGIVFLIASAYWLFPWFSGGQKIINQFSADQWSAFGAGGYKTTGPILNVLSLNGFWAQSQPWGNSFAWPADYSIFWISFGLIAVLSLLGLIHGIYQKKKREEIIFFALIGFFAFVFSTGAGETVFKNINLFLFDNVFFWRGFRDSQKFCGLMALAYSVLSGYGLNFILRKIKEKKKELLNSANLFFLFIPIFFGYLCWGGFHGQLRPVWYPESWTQAKQILDSDKSDYQILVLPWHGYFSLKFNRNLISANPGRRFFRADALVGQSMEISNVSEKYNDPNYIALDKIVREEENRTPDQTIDFFKEKNIKYIIFPQDLREVDPLKYEFLSSGNLKIILEESDLIMYRLNSE